MTRTSLPVFSDTAPRYTSYPTAPHFHAGVTASDVAGWMSRIQEAEPLSLYLHVPYCDRLCWFCACHTRHTLRYEPVAEYLGLVTREIALVSTALDGRGRVGALHFGGGSPTMLRPDDLKALVARLRRAFRFDEDAAFSFEIDPNDMDAARLDAIAEVGVNRASLGVQDFDPVVQRAINREQSYECTRDVVSGLRARGVAGVNLDLVYGLPHQTVDSVAETVRRCLDLAPDRIALFGYAHVPWFKKHQTMIDEAALPRREARLEQAAAAAEMILEAGYVAIGMDHFARPHDGLAVSAARGELGRNFQGYTDDRCENLIGLGPSSIGRLRQGYAQNVAALGDYRRAIENGELPVGRGLELTDDDRMRGWVIERLMCGFGFSSGELARRFGARAETLLAEASSLAAERPCLLVENADGFSVPDELRPHIRSIAARFDAYLSRGTARHSVAV